MFVMISIYFSARQYGNLKSIMCSNMDHKNLGMFWEGSCAWSLEEEVVRGKE